MLGIDLKTLDIMHIRDNMVLDLIGIKILGKMQINGFLHTNHNLHLHFGDKKNGQILSLINHSGNLVNHSNNQISSHGNKTRLIFNHGKIKHLDDLGINHFH
jgi:hypothetical protein